MASVTKKPRVESPQQQPIHVTSKDDALVELRRHYGVVDEKQYQYVVLDANPFNAGEIDVPLDLITRSRVDWFCIGSYLHDEKTRKKTLAIWGWISRFNLLSRQSRLRQSRLACWRFMCSNPTKEIVRSLSRAIARAVRLSVEGWKRVLKIKREWCVYEEGPRLTSERVMHPAFRLTADESHLLLTDVVSLPDIEASINARLIPTKTGLVRRETPQTAAELAADSLASFICTAALRPEESAALDVLRAAERDLLRERLEHCTVDELVQMTEGKIQKTSGDVEALVVPFEMVPSLVAKRSVLLVKGMAYVPSVESLKDALIHNYQLPKVAPVFGRSSVDAPCVIADGILRDKRLVLLAKRARGLLLKEVPDSQASSMAIHSIALFTPPCITTLHNATHLNNSQRVFYARTMRELGVPLKDLQQIWTPKFKAYYSRSHAAPQVEAAVKNVMLSFKHLFTKDKARPGSATSCHRAMLDNLCPLLSMPQADNPNRNPTIAVRQCSGCKPEEKVNPTTFGPVEYVKRLATEL